MNIEIINKLKKEKGLTNKQIADLSGITLSTLDKITSGYNTNPKLDTLQALCRVLGCSLDDLDDVPNGGKDGVISTHQKELLSKYEELDPYGQQAVDSILKIEHTRCTAKPETETVVNIEPVKTITLKHAYNKASAGDGFLDLGDMDTEIDVEYNELTHKADFCVTVTGRSMEPKFKDGDVLLVRQQPAVAENEIGIFIVDDKGYVKINGEKELISLNKKYPNIPKTENTLCFGKVVGVLKKDWIK